MSALRVVFMGTPDFAVPTLAALLAAGHAVVAVYTQPPRARGRGHKAQPSPVQAFAEQHGLAIHTPTTLKDAAAQAAFAALDADVAVVAAYGLLLPKAVLDAPRLGCLNVHASLLPRWRGAAPIQRAVLEGDSETGISIMQMAAGLDTGPVYVRAAVPIGATDTAGTVHDMLARLGGRFLVEVLDAVAAGAALPQPQDDALATYAPKITPAEARLDWTQDAARLERTVRAFNPWPGAWFAHDGTRIKVLGASVAEKGAADGPQTGGEPGTVLDNTLTVACGQGALVLRRLQRPGRGPLDAADFLRGYPLPPGTRLD